MSKTFVHKTSIKLDQSAMDAVKQGSDHLSARINYLLALSDRMLQAPPLSLPDWQTAILAAKDIQLPYKYGVDSVLSIYLDKVANLKPTSKHKFSYLTLHQKAALLEISRDYWINHNDDNAIQDFLQKKKIEIAF